MTLAVSRKIIGHFKHFTLAYCLLDEIRERLDTIYVEIFE